MAASSLALAGDCIRSPMSSVGGPGVHVLLVFFCDKSIERELAGIEAEDEDCCGKEGVGVRFVELLWIAKDSKSSIVLRRAESDEHGAGEQQRDGAREEAE